MRSVSLLSTSPHPASPHSAARFAPVLGASVLGASVLGASVLGASVLGAPAGHPARFWPTVRSGLVAGAVAGVVSGLPSTAHAFWTGQDAMAATRAAGELLGRPTLGRAVLVHGALSLGWGVVLAAVLPRRQPVLAGVAAGAAIAALDLGVVGRHLPPIAALATGPQVADHLMFGVVAGVVLARLGAADGPSGTRGPTPTPPRRGRMGRPSQPPRVRSRHG